MRRTLIGPILLAGLAALSGQPASAAQRLSLEQARSAVSEALRDAGRDGKTIHVTGVLGCIPAFREPGKWVCPLEIAGRDEPLPVTFLVTDKGWRVLRENAQPSCAPIAVASAAFGLKVKKEVDDGEGGFTSDRGMARGRKGAYRVMCRYVVETELDPDALFITYVWHDGDEYIIDDGVERWFP